jgi:hypothetical protein
MLMVAMDANFRLKSRLQAAINKEPRLGLGWGYFVNNEPYFDFIKDYVDEEEVCSIISIGLYLTNNICRYAPASAFRHY